MKHDLENCVVVITGASRGVGRATAIAFAAEGARVAAVGRDTAELEATVHACRDKGARAVRAYACDVMSDDSVNQTVHDIYEAFGQVDVLVNNAGVGRYAPFLDLELEDWQWMMDVNVIGLVRFTKAVLPHMIEHGAGDIINISSIQGLQTGPRASAYSASKYAVIGLSDALAQEVAEAGVRVSVLCPGGVLTNFAGKAAEDKNPAFLEPEDVAEAAVDIARTKGKAWLRRMILLPFNP